MRQCRLGWLPKTRIGMPFWGTLTLSFAHDYSLTVYATSMTFSEGIGLSPHRAGPVRPIFPPEQDTMSLGNL